MTSEIVPSCLIEFYWYLFLNKMMMFYFSKMFSRKEVDYSVPASWLCIKQNQLSICHCLPFLILTPYFAALSQHFLTFSIFRILGNNQHYVQSFLIVGTVSQQPFNFFSCSYCSSSKLCCYCPLFVQLTFTGLWERIRVSWLFFFFLHKLLIKDIPWMTKHCILCHTALTRLHEQ